MQARSLIIITGISGSGKSTALRALEDLGYFCVDNLPTPLINDFVGFLLNIPEEWLTEVSSFQPASGSVPRTPPKSFALLVDCRDGNAVRQVLDGMTKLRGEEVGVSLLYFDCADEVILRRFQETRRPHPLLVFGDGGKTLADALQRERELLADFRISATQIVDTTSYTPHQLRHLIIDSVGRKLSLEVVLESFGFRYGLPSDADVVMDVRFLPNPHFVRELREFTGTQIEVSDYALKNESGEKFMAQFEDLLRTLVPFYQAEGKSYLTVAVGCTGGRHRSVAVVEELKRRLKDLEIRISIRHRDKERPG